MFRCRAAIDGSELFLDRAGQCWGLTSEEYEFSTSNRRVCSAIVGLLHVPSLLQHSLHTGRGHILESIPLISPRTVHGLSAHVDCGCTIPFSTGGRKMAIKEVDTKVLGMASNLIRPPISLLPHVAALAGPFS